MKGTYIIFSFLICFVNLCCIGSSNDESAKKQAQILVNVGNDIYYELMKQYSEFRVRYGDHPHLESLYEKYFQPHWDEFNSVAQDLEQFDFKSISMNDIKQQLSTIIPLLQTAQSKIVEELSNSKQSMNRSILHGWRKELEVLSQSQHPRLGKQSHASDKLTEDVLRHIADQSELLSNKIVYIMHNQKPHVFCKIINVITGTVVWQGWLQGVSGIRDDFKQTFANCKGESVVPVRVPCDHLRVEFYHHVGNENRLCLAYNLTPEQVTLLNIIYSQLGGFSSNVVFYDNEHQPLQIPRFFGPYFNRHKSN